MKTKTNIYKKRYIFWNISFFNTHDIYTNNYIILILALGQYSFKIFLHSVLELEYIKERNI